MLQAPTLPRLDRPWPWIFLFGPALFFMASRLAQPLRQELYILAVMISAVGVTGLAGRRACLRAAAVSLVFGFLMLAAARHAAPKLYVPKIAMAATVVLGGLIAYDFSLLGFIVFSSVRTSLGFAKPVPEEPKEEESDAEED
jgi:hypothetical protein